MYFLLINIFLSTFFIILILVGIKIKIWSYIPANAVGLLVSGATLILDLMDQLNQLRILILLIILIVVFIIDFIITYRDIQEVSNEEDEKIIYLTNSSAFEHFKIIADIRLMKEELDKSVKHSISDRLQALQTWKLGNRAYMAKHYQEALKKYDLSCNWVSTSIAYLNQSGVLIKLKQHDDSIVFADKAIEINPKFYEAYMNLGVASQNLKRLNVALSKFEQAVNLKKDSFEAWFCYGNVQLKLKNYKNAVECYSKSIRLDSNYYEAWYNKGIALKNLGEAEQALKCFDQVVKINPKHYKAYYRRGNILNEMDYNEEAVTSYSLAVKIEPGYIEAWNNRGIVLCKLSRLKEAIKSYNRALKVNPNYYEALINRGLAQDSLGKYKQAFHSYRKFIELAPPEQDKYIKITKRRISEIKEQFKIKRKRVNKLALEMEKSSLEIQFAEDFEQKIQSPNN